MKSDEDVSNETKLTILQQERQMWLNTRELMTIRYRVNKRVDDKKAMEDITKELTKIETALDELDKMFTELQK